MSMHGRAGVSPLPVTPADRRPRPWLVGGLIFILLLTVAAMNFALRDEPATALGQGSRAVAGGTNGQCQPFTIDLAGLPAGTILEGDEFASQGVHISVEARGGSQFPDNLIVFDTNSTDEDLDEDLRRPEIGNILILAHDLDGGADGVVDKPDENNFGGVVTFTFDQPVSIGSFRFIDHDHQSGDFAAAYDASGNLIKKVFIPVIPEEGSVQTINVDADGVTRFVLDFRDSGGFTPPEGECPPGTPTPTPPGTPTPTPTSTPGTPTPPGETPTLTPPGQTPTPTPPGQTPTPTPPGQTPTPTPPGQTATPTPPFDTGTPTPPAETPTPTPPGETATPTPLADTPTPTAPADTPTPTPPGETATPTPPVDTGTPTPPAETPTPTPPGQTPTPTAPGGTPTPTPTGTPTPTPTATPGSPTATGTPVVTASPTPTGAVIAATATPTAPAQVVAGAVQGPGGVPTAGGGSGPGRSATATLLIAFGLLLGLGGGATALAATRRRV